MPATELQVVNLGSAEQPNVFFGTQGGIESWRALTGPHLTYLGNPKEAEGGVVTLCIAVATLSNDMGTVTRQPANKMRARKAMVQKATNRPRQAAVDACLRRVEGLCQTSGIDCVIVRVFDAAEDKSACKRVLRERDGWRNLPFRVAYYLDIEPSPWTGQHLDATTSPQCFADALDMARRLNGAPTDMPDAMKSRLQNLFNIYVDQCIDHIYQSALLVAVTPYAALGKVVKWFTRNRASVLAVDEAHVMQCVFNQSTFLFAFDPRQLPAFSASKTSPMVPRVNTYENQTISSLAERLFTLEWPIISMDQQFRVLPGLFDPAREAFYAQRNIVDIRDPGADTSVTAVVESWLGKRGGSPPPSGKFWPAFLNITGTRCEKVTDSKSSINPEMWEQFFSVLWYDLLRPNAEFRIEWNRLCIITPYRATTNYIKDYLRRRGLELTTSTVDLWKEPSPIAHPSQAGYVAEAIRALVLTEDSVAPDREEPTVRLHNPMKLDCATIDSYQGQEKDLVFFFSTVSALSGPKFVANANRLCVAFTRMRQALIVVGDPGTRTRNKKDIAEYGQHLDTRAFNGLWG
ncbi:hypothetical protein KVR01_006378 [Diaporthe batatas]|uniref:uncharacterized protein n=1 Tax=Diaporthe batatas TaxID=748121 RepID=UPI001D059EDF|nr:uncharacterized protein KVR01_006378 [Diaporthe batatas]KAG8164460.1 hypothetical protein KVR01_006378 [Diaporthe batatas]